MESKIIPFPTTADKPAVQDPVAERAQFFAEYELTELTATIPQAELSTEAKYIY